MGKAIGAWISWVIGLAMAIWLALHMGAVVSGIGSFFVGLVAGGGLLFRALIDRYAVYIGAVMLPFVALYWLRRLPQFGRNYRDQIKRHYSLVKTRGVANLFVGVAGLCALAIPPLFFATILAVACADGGSSPTPFNVDGTWAGPGLTATITHTGDDLAGTGAIRFPDDVQCTVAVSGTFIGSAVEMSVNKPGGFVCAGTFRGHVSGERIVGTLSIQHRAASDQHLVTASEQITLRRQ